ncbi:hypothetical protein ACFZDG_39645 [Kitasatospora xanthocidica]|uniref:hypothetical protein n=1 Tax=Kitasatospora xanthocidica TaxID=83382 RepID=UPI0036EB6E73
MTSLHPTATDPSLPGPPGDSAGSPPPPAVPGQPAAAVPMCSIATAAEAATTTSGTADGVIRHDSVPQPRSREDAQAFARPAAVPAPVTAPVTAPAGEPGAEPVPADGGPAAASLRAAFAERLRAARAQGRSVTELAEVCGRPVDEVRALLGEGEPGEGEPGEGEPAEGVAAVPADAGGHDGERSDGAEAGARAGIGSESGFVRFRSASAPSDGGLPAPARRPVREEPRILGSRRPSPSRRLRRMHPQADPSGQEAAARETAAPGPGGTGFPGAAAWTGELGGPEGTVTGRVSLGAGAATGCTPGSGVPDATTPYDGASPTEPPLGILIGGSPGQSEALGRPEERAPVRVVAEVIRAGRGTSLVVLPSWRPAIAVSVPTDQLLSATGLGFERLAGTRLTVLMNPGALHDRELELHGWEAGPLPRPRRGGRP